MSLVIHIFILLLTLLGMAIIVSTRNIIHAAYALALTLIGISGVYVLLNAELLAVVQILLYAGGVVILLVFGVMLTSRLRGDEIVSQVKNRLLGGVVAALLFIGLVFLFSQQEISGKKIETSDQVGEIAISFLTKHLVSFELIAFILLVALVGASYLAKRSTDE